MSKATVYFLGGPMDLTKRVMEVAGRHIVVPVFAQRPRAAFVQPTDPVHLATETVTYNLRRVGERTWIAQVDE